MSQTEQVRRRDGARVPPAPVATAAPPTAATAPLVTVSAEELRLIQQTTQALRDHRAALAQELLQQHASLFPDGMLAQERSGLTVLALCQQGASPKHARCAIASSRRTRSLRFQHACAWAA